MCPSWVAVVAGFLGGSVVAWGIGFVVTRWIIQPVISVCTDDGSYGPVSFFDTATESHPARYLRLRVENTGLSTLKDCCGFIENMRKHTDTGQHVPRKVVIDLGWAYKNNEKGNTRDIPRGVHFYMDVVTLDLRPGEPGQLRLSHMSSTTLQDLFKDKGTYEFEVIVAADNARPQRGLKVKVDFDPAQDDLQLTPLDATRLPWWRRP